MLDITKDIHSLTTFRRRSGDFMKQLKRSKRPVRARSVTDANFNPLRFIARERSAAVVPR
jgi:hypothetical protein